MTKYVPNKEHSRTALIFCFHLKKTAAESYQLFGETYGEHAPSQKTCEHFDGFSVSKLEISMLQTRNTENRSKNTKTWNCKHWMKMIHKHKNNSQSNWALVNSCFQSPTRDGKDSESRVPHELNERQMERRKNIMWNFVRTIQKKIILLSYRYWWKVVFFRIQAQKIMGRPIHIDRKTESLWQEDALCLMELEGCDL